MPAPLNGHRLQTPRAPGPVEVTLRGFPIAHATAIPAVVHGEVGEFRLTDLIAALRAETPVEFIPGLGGWPGELASACAEQLPAQIAALKAAALAEAARHAANPPKTAAEALSYARRPARSMYRDGALDE